LGFGGIIWPPSTPGGMESGGKPPHSKTGRRTGCARATRSVVECGTKFRFHPTVPSSVSICVHLWLSSLVAPAALGLHACVKSGIRMKHPTQRRKA
jgi:hypothetical protein